jgi:8-oxo-dGTP diphosphatase
MEQLPRVMMITGSDSLNKEVFLKKLELHLKSGIKLVQLRAKELTEAEYISLARSVMKLRLKYNAIVILNTDIKIAESLNGDGVHLSSSILMGLTVRPFAKDKIISAACHNLEQLEKARLIGADLVTLSPVNNTNTHPEAIPLGWNKFSQLCKSVNIPIYALGGIDESDLAFAITQGAYGISAISSLWDRKYL